MGDSQASVETIAPDQPSPASTISALTARLNAVLILPTHLDRDELAEVELQIKAAGGTTTKAVSEAQLVLTAISSPRRARFELQVRGIDTSQLALNTSESPSSAHDTPDLSAPRKRRRITPRPEHGSPARLNNPEEARTLKENDVLATWLRVVKLEWFIKSCKDEAQVPIEPFIILEGPCHRPPGSRSPYHEKLLGFDAAQETTDQAEPKITVVVPPHQPLGSEKEGKIDHSGIRSKAPAAGVKSVTPDSDPGHVSPPASFTDAGAETEGSSPEPTDMPDWVTNKVRYACERRTPPDSPNADFIEQLKKIRLTRTLTLDEVGVRAYSTSIAAVAAFPRRLASAREVAALPGCDAKIARLFREFRRAGRLAAADQLETDPALAVIAQFYDIHGVGARTAREFYYERGWRSTDDIVEHGWADLTRVQQIGLKYQDEFAHAIPRAEVEYIASVVTYHARTLVDEQIECIIVGGYRRGKAASGDVDLILSHRREEATAHLIRPLVHRLERAGWVTHVLTLSERNSSRDQQPLPIRPRNEAGGGFDGLDKASDVPHLFSDLNHMRHIVKGRVSGTFLF